MISQVIFSIVLSIAIFLLAFNLEFERMGLASNLSALMIVLGGTLAATLVAYPWKKLIWTARLLKKAFSSRNDVEWTIDAIVTLASTYRKSGIRALEEMGKKIPSGALKTAVELIAYNYTKDEIERILEKEARITYSQYETAHKILYNMARLAPALGLAGTIISLIRIFGHITDSQSMVGYMAIALLNTFYGVVFANLCLHRFPPRKDLLRVFSQGGDRRREFLPVAVESRLPIGFENTLDITSQESRNHRGSSHANHFHVWRTQGKGLEEMVFSRQSSRK